MQHPLNKKLLGSTDVWLSPLSLGTVKIGRNQGVKYPSGFDLPDDKSVNRLLQTAQRLGVTSIDTAPAYGISEQRLGPLLKGQRQQFQIIGKAGEHFIDGQSHYDFSAKGLKAQLEQSLKHLQTDYLDCWLLHCNNDDLENLTDEALHCLQQAKQDGWVKSIGASTKTVAAGEKALTYLDCAMITASLDYSDEDSLFSFAEERDKGILLKKIFNSGWGLHQNDNKAAFQAQSFKRLFGFAASCSAVVGTLNPKHLTENVQAFNSQYD